MYEILLLFVKLKNDNSIEKTIDSFLENCKDNYLINKTICMVNNKNDEIKLRNKYKKINILMYNPIFDLSSYYFIFKSYKYLIYVDDSWVFHNKYNFLTDSIYLLKKNKFNQVFFTNITDKEKKKFKKKNNIYEITSQELDMDKSYFKFELVKQILLENYKTNDYPDKLKEYQKSKTKPKIIDYNIYTDLNNDYINWNQFKLIPSIIDTNIFSVIKLNLPKNIYKERLFSDQYEINNFKSCYLTKNLSKNISYNNLDKPNYDNITIVTGFVEVTKTAHKRSTQKYSYFDRAIPTLSIPQNMVIFIEKKNRNFVENIRKEKNLLDKTIIIEIEKKDLYMYDKIEILKKNCEKNWPPYNNPYFIMVVNSRYKYIQYCIDHKLFNTDYYAWIDFSASHIVDIPENMKIYGKNNQKIRISWIARQRLTFNHKCLGGGIFIGHKSILPDYIKLHDKEFKKLMYDGFCINDDRLLFIIFLKYPELFDISFSGYKNMFINI